MIGFLRLRRLANYREQGTISERYSRGWMQFDLAVTALYTLPMDRMDYFGKAESL
jgi:hypothetical protein